MRKISHWTETYDVAESLDINRELARIVLDDPITEHHEELQNLRKWVMQDRLDKLALYDVPLSLPANAYRVARQVCALFSKLDYLEIGIDRKAVAIEAFMGAEAQCRITNDYIRRARVNPEVMPPMLHSVLHHARRKMAELLGPRPTLDELALRFGPGATSLTKKREASVKVKLGCGVSCSEELIGWVRALLTQMPALTMLNADQSAVGDDEWWATISVAIHEGVVSFVRKNAKTDRTTETQPTLNGMLQLAIGDFLTEYRLGGIAGLDLSDQALNQRLAWVGSLTGEIATLDLKSASNLNAYELVRELTPEDWFSLLKAARVGTTRVPGIGPVRLEMFSGMGNGFTFPLESLIFYSLCWGVAIHRGYGRGNMPIISVYGDDIAVDSDLVDDLRVVLRLLGHTVNSAKSFWEGPFRESCGTDWYSGIDVRPIYPKEVASPAVLFSLHNGLYRKGFTKAAEWVHDLVHPNLRLYGPEGYGDGHLLKEDWQAYARPKNRELGWEGVTFQTFTKKPKRDFVYRRGDKVLPVYSIYVRGKGATEEEKALRLLQKAAEPVVVQRPYGPAVSFARAWYRGHGTMTVGTLPIPFAPKSGDLAEKSWEGQLSEEGLYVEGLAKATTFPGSDGYRKITVYTLDR